MIFIHYLLVAVSFILSTQLGFFRNKKSAFRYDSIQNRPSEDVVSVLPSIK